MTKLSAWRMAGVMFLLFAATAIAAPAQRFNILAVFNETNGATPNSMPLTQGVDGNFYGTAFHGRFAQDPTSVTHHHRGHRGSQRGPQQWGTCHGL
jgi:hypothetical protein